MNCEHFILQKYYVCDSKYCASDSKFLGRKKGIEISYALWIYYRQLCCGSRKGGSLYAADREE